MRFKYEPGEKKPLRTVLSSHCKVTPERRHELVQIHLHMGFEVSSRECLESGVRAAYAEDIARSEHGHRTPRKSKVVPKPPHKTRANGTDPRWARAVAVGMVVA